LLARWLAPVLQAGLVFAGIVSGGTAPAGVRVNPWAAWVNGSWVVYDIESTASEPRTVKQSLVAVDAESYTLESETSWPGGSSAEEQVLSLATMGYPHALADAQRVASEPFTVAGKTFDCEVWRARYTDRGEAWDAIAWISPELEHPLKIRLKGPATVELEVDRLEDYLTVARRKFRCVRYAGAVISEGQRAPLAQWRSSEIPGGLVRSETMRDTPEGRIAQTTHVREFRGERAK
jgi:hypothetical protein